MHLPPPRRLVSPVVLVGCDRRSVILIGRDADRCTVDCERPRGCFVLYHARPEVCSLYLRQRHIPALKTRTAPALYRRRSTRRHAMTVSRARSIASRDTTADQQPDAAAPHTTRPPPGTSTLQAHTHLTHGTRRLARRAPPCLLTRTHRLSCNNEHGKGPTKSTR